MLAGRLDSLSSALGFLILLAVVGVSVIDRGQTEIRYLDWHAAIVVVGGVCGSLLIAVKGSSFFRMIYDWIRVIFGQDPGGNDLRLLKEEVTRVQEAWSAGRRSEVLTLAETTERVEMRIAIEVLVQRAGRTRLTERFEFLRHRVSDDLLPQIEGWDLVARLAPSFGIVGTVAGMVQLFRNMASNQGNLGGAMALALLSTLYGILLGTGLGGPMSTRLTQRMNERLNAIDLLEREISALIDEERRDERRAEAGL